MFKSSSSSSRSFVDLQISIQILITKSLKSVSASMSRKVGKSSSSGQRRRSPRISALHSCKDNPQKGTNSDDALAALPPLSKLSKQVWKGRDSPQNAADCVEWRSLKENQNHGDDHHNNLYTNDNGNGNASEMPAKHILELLLDTLQRRDTYEIFGQPVDPDEVEDYYEIIKEPMDFGTMRAKLHEGMYQNLQQFEHDVFLIPENAMHFNSSTTTYFRQARAIHELANKVFHVLKTNPQNFVSEFSGTRRRSMRKALSECKDPPQCPSTSTFRTSNRKSPAFHFGRVSDSQVVDRRETYLSGKEEEDEPVYSRFSKQALVLMNQGDISYEDSLMWYVKELGPTAKMIAKRKLLGQQHQSSNKRCQQFVAKEFKTFRDFAPAACNPFVKASNTIDLTLTIQEEAKMKHRKRKEKTADKNSMVRDFNCSSRPVILALENYHNSEFKTRNKKSCNASAPPTRIITDESAQPQQLQQQKPLPLIPHFTFDLHFLKARLDQMKAVEMKEN